MVVFYPKILITSSKYKTDYTYKDLPDIPGFASGIPKWYSTAQYDHSQSKKKLGIDEKYRRSIKVHT